MQEINASGYFFSGPSVFLEKREFKISQILPNEVVVQVAGCGLCHTDLSFLTQSVKTKQTPPLILGHEISGKVVAAEKNYENLIGSNVIVPAVLPCGECEFCQNERENICQKQKMPGNDFNGGFASHIVVPAKFLCVLPKNLKTFELSQLSVIADAVTTPYQSAVRSRIQRLDVAIVIGVGGIGIYMVQHARNAGALVIAIDIDEKKLQNANSQGAVFSICAKNKDEKQIKLALRDFISKNNL
ncbi:MAG: alcohol dehydrogenase catalytic domain-containing protein, partial [Deltaproteobacteria bacterium]|nr:alcohol dehydrogenase catalytic domain-containing protein [Deltaproteobacteria bacterium]